jgi:hypothetical protein
MAMTSYTFNNLSDKVFRKNDTIVSRKIAGETFLVPVRGNLADMQSIYTLNRVAEFIWEELNNKSLNDICSNVIETFEVERKQAESDICDFIRELSQADLIRAE